MKTKLLCLPLALLAGCATPTTTTELRFNLGGTNDFVMTSPKEVSASYMALSAPNGMTMVISNYVSKINSPTDALAAALDKAISAYMQKGGMP